VLIITIDVFYYLADRDGANDKRISKMFLQNAQYVVYIFLGILTTDLLDLDNISKNLIISHLTHSHAHNYRDRHRLLFNSTP